MSSRPNSNYSMAPTKPNFFDVPRELRDGIYELFLSLLWESCGANYSYWGERSYGLPHVLCSFCRYAFIPTREYDGRSDDAFYTAFQSLLLVNKQMQQEFKEVAERHVQHIAFVDCHTDSPNPTSFSLRECDDSMRQAFGKTVSRDSLRYLEIQLQEAPVFLAFNSRAFVESRRSVREALTVFPALDCVTLTLLIPTVDFVFHDTGRYGKGTGIQRFLDIPLLEDHLQQEGHGPAVSRVRTFRKLVVAPSDTNPGMATHWRIDTRRRRCDKMIPGIACSRDLRFWKVLRTTKRKRPDLLGRGMGVTPAIEKDTVLSIREYLELGNELYAAYEAWEATGKPGLGSMRRQAMQEETELALEDFRYFFDGKLRRNELVEQALEDIPHLFDLISRDEQLEGLLEDLPWFSFGFGEWCSGGQW